MTNSSDPFRLKRQPCRCGETFATLQAFLVHADYGEPLPHDDPRQLGLHQQADGEWTHIIPPVETDLRKHAVKPASAPKEPAKPYVPAAERPAHEFDRTCVKCGTTFTRPRGRGRPPKSCPTCRGIDSVVS